MLHDHNAEMARLRAELADARKPAASGPPLPSEAELRAQLRARADQVSRRLDRAYVNRLWKTAVLSAGITWIPQDTGMHMLKSPRRSGTRPERTC